MKNSPFKIPIFLFSFFILVFAFSIANNPHYPILIIAGESSVGTWMSGVLLIISGTVSLIIGLRNDWFRWFFVGTFFFILALDERFMFHEQLKEYIIFSYNIHKYWIYEMPVIVGSCLGAIVAWLLWHNLEGVNRILLLSAIILGITSVIFDILTKGVLLEECFKLIAELSITCSLLRKIEEDMK